MTQKGWTNLILPVDFAEKLTATAREEGLPVWKYIEKKVIDSRSILAGVQGFESLPPHFILIIMRVESSQMPDGESPLP